MCETAGTGGAGGALWPRKALLGPLSFLVAVADDKLVCLPAKSWLCKALGHPELKQSSSKQADPALWPVLKEIYSRA